MDTNVFSRTDTNDEIISAASYNLVIGLTLLWGFIINYFMVANIPTQSILEFGFWPFIIAYFISCFFGIYLFNKSDNPVVSFIGYNFVVVPFGLVINIVVSQFDPEIVLAAVRVTGMVTFVMMLLGSAYPAFFERIAGGLFIALICVIVVQLIEMFFFGTQSGILDWIVALIFCGYIGYDWARANAIPKTYDNAIDSAAALYIDIINLFLRILRIMARR
ncbi:Bax inhibitor-1 family protein [Paraferrimonas sp. SM1919]|uniref:Bax inhibitor-1 family protein n=1 Tax=Paraferrimonas sp. SM1919 TaxID=2662263 RepID=UPI0013D24F3F|nr:Bax inhibitor-1 family protein [Paraferrimonas sp. SM1919]